MFILFLIVYQLHFFIEGSIMCFLAQKVLSETDLRYNFNFTFYICYLFMFLVHIPGCHECQETVRNLEILAKCG